MGMMEAMVKSLGRERRESMMMDMMPLMMDGIEMHNFMPQMMGAMLENLTAEGLVTFLKDALGEKETARELLEALQNANLMQKMMFTTHTSTLGFDETVTRLEANAKANGWQIPDTRNLQEEYHRAGHPEMTRCTVLYFCNPHGGFSIVRNDEFKPMSVMMPMGVSVYEKSGGEVEIAAMNLGMMSSMFPGEVREVLADGAERFTASLNGIV